MSIPDPGSWIRIFSIPDPGSWIKIFCILHPESLIPDLNFFHPGSWIPDVHLSILTKKNGFSARRNMIRVFDPGSGSRIWILTFYLSQIPILDPRSRIQGSKRHRIPNPRSLIRICNIGDFGFAHAVGGSVGY
jgi:hypothetical protein